MRRAALSLVMAVLAVALATPALAQTSSPGEAVVRGVFFFSPTCPHCEAVIADDLPGIFEDAGGAYTVGFDESLPPDEVAFFLLDNGTLQLLMVDTSVESGARMFAADSERLGLERAGVPRLDIAGETLVGSVDIPARLPIIIEAGLAVGGIDWPPVPGLSKALAPFDGVGTAPLGDPDVSIEPGFDDRSVLDTMGRDPVGNSLAVIVLVALLASLVLVPTLAVRGSLAALGSALAWLVPLVAAAGFVVAAYLAVVEATGREAVCGPVGDCNTVQGSEYAVILGIPIGVVGIVGYAALLGLWAASRVTAASVADVTLVLLATGAFAGTLFSVYLTFLEPFVIGATCLWCLSSALAMLALWWLSADPGWQAWLRLRRSPPSRGHRSGAATSLPADRSA